MDTILQTNIFKCISLNDNFWILNRVSEKYVPYGQIDNMAALIRKWLGVEQVTEAMIVCLLTHIMCHSASMN